MPHLNSRLMDTVEGVRIFKRYTVQLNEYETVPYFLQFSQNLTSNCLLISVYLPVFASSCMMLIKLVFLSAEQFYEHIMRKLVKTGKSTEINKQSDVKFWLN